MRRHGRSLSGGVWAWVWVAAACVACVAEPPPTIDEGTCNQAEGTDRLELQTTATRLAVGSQEEAVLTVEAFCASRSSEHLLEVSENRARVADSEGRALGVMRDVATGKTAQAFMVLEPGRGEVQVAYACVQPGEALLQVRDRFSQVSESVKITCYDPNADE